MTATNGASYDYLRGLVKDQLDQLRRFGPIVFEIFETLGHNPMEEDPKATAAAVAAFIKPITPRPALPPEPPPVEQTVQPSVVPEKD